MEFEVGDYARLDDGSIGVIDVLDGDYAVVVVESCGKKIIPLARLAGVEVLDVGTEVIVQGLPRKYRVTKSFIDKDGDILAYYVRDSLGERDATLVVYPCEVEEAVCRRKVRLGVRIGSKLLKLKGKYDVEGGGLDEFVVVNGVGYPVEGEVVIAEGNVLMVLEQ